MLWADICMEADFGGNFQCGGRLWGQIYLWRQISEVDLHMEGELFFMGWVSFAPESKTCYSVSPFFNKGRST
jgi:hypothetical protein